VSIFKHIALTSSSNKNLLFTDKFTFLQKQLFELGVSIFKHIALTGSSNKNLLFTDKFTFLQKTLFELGVIFHFTLVLSKVFDNNFIQNFY
jgi:hypothetical protein